MNREDTKKAIELIESSLSSMPLAWKMMGYTSAPPQRPSPSHYKAFTTKQLIEKRKYQRDYRVWAAGEPRLNWHNQPIEPPTWYKGPIQSSILYIPRIESVSSGGRSEVG